ncbi:TetR/AcrR family transcriptional regulator [Amycolatopsis sp. NPDC005232]|uniref:TetR/AcrR family transcriptional regulator n=1 Tax=Amycolatopsis sp. NPDC005232 TaxID=3157027 RepID=UPI0033A0F67D
MDGGEIGSRRLTARGAATRERITRAAADLIHAQGAAATSIEQVVEASGTSRSQVYHYFADKDALISAVIKSQGDRTFANPQLEQLQSLQGLWEWRDQVVRNVRATRGAYGCAIGGLASELNEHSEPARILLAAALRTWESYLAAGLSRMRASGDLRPETDVAKLAAGIMAALQGGYLLSQTARDAEPMEHALDMALGYVRCFASVNAGV